MVKTRSFQIVLVSKGHGTGVEVTGTPDKAISYNGETQTIQLAK